MAFGEARTSSREDQEVEKSSSGSRLRTNEQGWNGAKGFVVLVTACVIAACAGTATTTSSGGGSGSSQATGASTTTAPELTSVSLRLDWIITGEHSEYYVTREKGFFEEEGLDVNIKEGAGSSVSLSLVGSQEDDFGFAGFGPLTLAAQEGVPAIMVMGIYRKSPHAIFSLESSGIRGPEDLAGKTLGSAPGEAPLTLLPAYLTPAGVSVDEVDVVNIDPAAKIAALCSGDVDAITGDVQSELPVLQAECGEPIASQLYADFEAVTMGHGINVHPDTAAERPDIVAAFVRALQRGIDYTRANPAEAVGIMTDLFPQTVPEDIGRAQLDAVLSLLDSPFTEGQPIGWIAAEQIEQTLSLLQEYGGLESPLSPEEYFTNEFIED